MSEALTTANVDATAARLREMLNGHTFTIETSRFEGVSEDSGLCLENPGVEVFRLGGSTWLKISTNKGDWTVGVLDEVRRPAHFDFYVDRVVVRHYSAAVQPLRWKFVIDF